MRDLRARVGAGEQTTGLHGGRPPTIQIVQAHERNLEFQLIGRCCFDAYRIAGGLMGTAGDGEDVVPDGLTSSSRRDWLPTWTQILERDYPRKTKQGTGVLDRWVAEGRPT